MGKYKLNLDCNMAQVEQKLTTGKLKLKMVVPYNDIKQLLSQRKCLADLTGMRSDPMFYIPAVTSDTKAFRVGKFDAPDWTLVHSVGITDEYDHLDVKHIFDTIEEAYKYLSSMLRKWRNHTWWDDQDIIELHDNIKWAFKLMWEGYVDPCYKVPGQYICDLDVDWSITEVYWLNNIICYAAMWYSEMRECFDTCSPTWYGLVQHTRDMARRLYSVAVELRNFVIIAESEEYVTCL